jgi:hypothetical protein
MYQSDFFEFFSKVHPSMPFIFWIPMTSWVLGSALLNGTTTWQVAAAAVPLGYLTWQFLEYFVHKHVFHAWPGWTGHGFHHKYPDDDTRLVMPLPVSIVGSAPVPQSASSETAVVATGHRPSGSVSVTTMSVTSRYSLVSTTRVEVTMLPWIT